MMKRLGIAIGVIIVLLFSTVGQQSQSASAQNNCIVDLGFDQDGVLPSSQGLTYFSGPGAIPESSVFSVSDGLLHQNSLGTASAAYYFLPNAYDRTKDFVLEFRMKVFPGTGLFGVAFEASDAVTDLELGFTDSGISLPPPPNSGPFLPFTTTDDFHVYQLTGAAGLSTYQLYVDGTLVASNIVSDGDPASRFFFGDSTISGGDGQADIDYVRYCLSDPDSQTMSPTSYDMLNGNNENLLYLDRSYVGSGDPTQPSSTLSGGLGDLADGIVAGQNWFAVEPAAPSNGPYVGWDRNKPLGLNPTITFHFGCIANIDSVTVYADDSSTGGVGTPLSVAMSMGGTSESFAFPDPPGTNPVFETFAVNLNPGTALDLTVSHRTQWVFLSEVIFKGSCDTTPPLVNVSFPASNGQNGWFISSPVVGSVTADETLAGGSNIAAISCAGATVGAVTGLNTPSATAQLSISAEGVSNVECTATDSAGNSGAATNSNNTATIQIDTVAPAILITSPANGGTYALNSVVASNYSCSDTDSGIATCAGTVANSANFSTNPVNLHSFTVMATDLAGNQLETTNTYNVTYGFSGFFSPVDNPGPGPMLVFNRAKAGSAIPIKFSLGGNQGLNIFATGYPKSERVDCSTSGSLDDIEETATAGNSVLTYDASIGQYLYVWKSDKAWAGSCRKLTVRLADGTDHIAYFNFTK